VKEQRGSCPACGQTKAVTARGVMRQHLPPRLWDSPRFRDICSGTGQPPAPARYPDSEESAR